MVIFGEFDHNLYSLFLQINHLNSHAILAKDQLLVQLGVSQAFFGAPVASKIQVGIGMVPIHIFSVNAAACIKKIEIQVLDEDEIS